MVGVWEGLNLGSIPNFFLCFGMHPKIIDVYPKLIPKGGVVQFCPSPPLNGKCQISIFFFDHFHFGASYEASDFC